MKFGAKLLFITIASVILLSCAAEKVEEKPAVPLYLSHNLWYDDPTWIEAINFKQSRYLIPAGTPVFDVTIYEGYDARQYGYTCVAFKVENDPNPYHLTANKRYQKGGGNKLTLEELKTRTFTPQTFEEMTANLKPQEIENIKRGTIQKGMSKEAVLMSWGYPPLHETPSLDAIRWRYWKKRTSSDIVDFGADGRVVESTWYGKGGNPRDVIE